MIYEMLDAINGDASTFGIMPGIQPGAAIFETPPSIGDAEPTTPLPPIPADNGTGWTDTHDATPYAPVPDIAPLTVQPPIEIVQPWSTPAPIGAAPSDVVTLGALPGGVGPITYYAPGDMPANAPPSAATWWLTPTYAPEPSAPEAPPALVVPPGYTPETNPWGAPPVYVPPVLTSPTYGDPAPTPPPQQPVYTDPYPGTTSLGGDAWVPPHAANGGSIPGTVVTTAAPLNTDATVTPVVSNGGAAKHSPPSVQPVTGTEHKPVLLAGIAPHGNAIYVAGALALAWYVWGKR